MKWFLLNASYYLPANIFIVQKMLAKGLFECVHNTWAKIGKKFPVSGFRSCRELVNIILAPKMGSNKLITPVGLSLRTFCAKSAKDKASEGTTLRLNFFAALREKTLICYRQSETRNRELKRLYFYHP